MQTYKQIIAGGGSITLPGGKIIEVLDCTYAVNVQPLGGGNLRVPGERSENVLAGWKVKNSIGFTGVIVENTDPVNPNTVIIGISASGDAEYLNMRGSVNVLGVPTFREVYGNLTTLADVSLAPTATTLIYAGNANQQEVLITNLSTNTQTLRIGDLNAGAARGIPLAPGSAIILNTVSAIYGYNPGAAAQSVAVVLIGA